MSQCSLSVALCTYNGSAFLLEQLKSIAEQTLQPEELIISDDGSQDHTLEIATQFAKQAKFKVRLHANPSNVGSTKNFERAIQLSEGDIILLSDQDDVWRKDKLERLAHEFGKSSDFGAVFSDAEVVDDQLSPLGYTLWERYAFTPGKRRQFLHGCAFAVLLNQNAVTGATLAFRSWLKPYVLPIPPGWMHDAWIGIIAAVVSKIGLIPEPLISYRQHETNQIGGRRPSWPQYVKSAWHDNSSFYKEYVLQLQQLRQRLGTFQMPALHKQLAMLDARILHFEARSRLPVQRFRRVPLAIKELLTLRYFRHSNGGISLAKDLILPRK